MTDIPLNEAGKLQARKLAQYLKEDGDKWDAIVSSPLSRAYDTARIIARELQIPQLESDPLLAEKAFGLAEGTTEQERIERWGADWRSRPLGVESNDEVTRRGMAFLRKARQGPWEHLLVVSHGAWIVHLLDALFPGLEYPYIGNASLTVLTYENGRWNPERIGYSGHL